MADEAALHPSGACRPRRRSRLHRRPFPQGASRIHARIEAVIGLLLTHPRIGVQTGDPTIRRITAVPYPYLIFYEATDEEVIIHAVRHGARDPASMPGAS